MKTFPSSFKKVVDYLKTHHDVTANLGSVTNYMKSKKEITIHFNYDLNRNGLYTLLHEAGHALQPNEVNDVEGVNRYKGIDDLEKPRKYAMYLFLNEKDAWDRGWDLAEQLNLNLDIKDYNRERDISLLTYFEVD